MLFIWTRDIDLLRPTGSGRSPIILFMLLVLCEIAPIVALMDYSFMTMFEFADSATREMTSLARGRHVLRQEEDEMNAPIIDQLEEGVDEAPVLGASGSFGESTDPLLARDAS